MKKEVNTADERAAIWRCAVRSTIEAVDVLRERLKDGKRAIRVDDMRFNETLQELFDVGRNERVGNYNDAFDAGKRMIAKAQEISA